MDALRFKSFLTDPKKAEIPESYLMLIIKKILGYDLEDLCNLTYFEYLDVVNFSLTTYKLQCNVFNQSKNTGSQTEYLTFQHEPDWDIDPTFVSDVNYHEPSN